MISHSSLLFEHPLWKDPSPGVHITCLIRKSCIWTLNKAGPRKSMQLNSKRMNSKQLPRGLYYFIKIVQQMFTSTINVEQTSGWIYVRPFRILFTSGWIHVRPFGILFTLACCSLRATARLRRLPQVEFRGAYYMFDQKIRQLNIEQSRSPKSMQLNSK